MSRRDRNHPEHQSFGRYSRSRLGYHRPLLGCATAKVQNAIPKPDRDERRLHSALRLIDSRPSNKYSRLFTAGEGVEPSLDGPKPSVLPLHHPASKRTARFELATSLRGEEENRTPVYAMARHRNEPLYDFPKLKIFRPSYPFYLTIPRGIDSQVGLESHLPVELCPQAVSTSRT